MRNGTCPGCQVPVVFADYGGATLVLDKHECAGGAGRYTIFDDGSVHPVTARAEVLAYPVHVCAALDRLRREGALIKDYVAT